MCAPDLFVRGPIVARIEAMGVHALLVANGARGNDRGVVVDLAHLVGHVKFVDVPGWLPLERCARIGGDLHEEKALSKWRGFKHIFKAGDFFRLKRFETLSVRSKKTVR